MTLIVMLRIRKLEINKHMQSKIHHLETIILSLPAIASKQVESSLYSVVLCSLCVTLT